ncbi:MAG: D-alanyl-D-alanine carboxypeptidase [Opitutus sp.]|nr:D-alanyl-D-alanine carboxypeptidase [Opitutus sp.]
MKLVVPLIVLWLSCVAAAFAQKSTGSFTGAVAIDAATGQVLAEESADTQNPPASMTKLMTFAVLHDALAAGTLTLQTPVQIDVADSRMGGTQVFLDPRETFTVEELLYAMMIQSANDAAHALARAAAGSVPAFVERMNAKAHALGMNATTFRTPHGLPPPSRRVSEGDLSTSRDFALLCRHLIRQTDVLKYTAIRERPFGPARTQGLLQMRNHNNLLGKVAGVDGLKTGYTAAAGYCLSATAERNGRRVIAVVMGALGPGRTVDKGRFRDLKAIEFLDRGFAALAQSPASEVGGALRPDSAAANPTSGRKAPSPISATDALPTVKTESTAPPAAAASTSTDLTVTFRVTPPASTPKKK